MPSGSVRRRFTAILGAEWQGVIGSSWKPLEDPCLCPQCSYEDVGRLQVKGGPGEDQQVDVPQGEGSPQGPSGGFRGARGHNGGQGRQ